MTQKFPAKYLFLLLVLISAVFSACQDDPDLVPLDDGVPIVTPKSKASIFLIQLNEFPDTDLNGNTWDIVDPAVFDSLGEADIFFNITDPSPQPPVFWSQNSHFSDVSPPDTIPFVLLDNFEVIPFGSSIDVNIYDYELPDSTLMGTVNFTIGPFPDLTEPNIAYPTYVTRSQNGYEVTIGIRWED